MTPDTDSVLSTLKKRGYRMTPQRRAIVSEIMKSEGHISGHELVERVKDRLPGVNDSTVYRTLDLLEEMGFLSHAHLGEGPAYHHVGVGDHIHLICERCGAAQGIPESEAGEMEAFVNERTGFTPDFTHFAISGLCAECRAAVAAGGD